MGKLPCIPRGIEHREGKRVLRKKGVPGRYTALRTCAKAQVG